MTPPMLIKIRHRLEVGTELRGGSVVEDTVQRFCFQRAGNETAEVWQAGYFNDFDREFHRTFDLHLEHPGGV